MGWSGAWPASQWDTPDDEDIFNDLVAALGERDALVPAGFVPEAFSRLDVIRGVPHGTGGPTGTQTVANFQWEIAQMLAATGPWRWWDRTRDGLTTLANLLADAIGQGQWSHDLTVSGAAWTPPFPEVFNELHDATSALTTVRRLAASAVSSRTDSVYELTFGITDWAAQRAAVFALFDGVDDGVDTGLTFDVGLSGVVFDSGSDQQWYLDAREMTLTFDTSGLAGCTVERAWIEFTTEACGGSTDFSDTFTAEVANAGGTSRGTFASDDTTLKSFELPAEDVSTVGDTVLTLRSQRANSADRSAWSPSGPDYSSTYREGFDLGDTLRLVVEVAFDYGA